jgi:plastocyanin
VRDAAGRWRIAQYNLSVPIPNERFDEVKDIIAGKRPDGDAPQAGAGVIRGFVKFTGKVPIMKVASKRRDTDYCKRFMVPHNAVIVKDGKLADTLVRIEVGGVKGSFKAPAVPARMAASSCTYQPRMLGVMAGQEVEINNGDGTLHNPHAWRGRESLFNEAQSMGAAPIVRSFDEPGLIRLSSDVYPWMLSFIAVTDHPFFAVSEADGSFQIAKVPAGKYALEAWHSIYGVKKATVEVIAGQTVELLFSYDGKEPEPPENQGELKAL